jgi:hypothetical protein
MLTNMTAFWSVGDRTVPFELCAEANEPLRNACFDRLISMINFDYAGRPEEKELYCSKIRNIEYQNQCKR